MVPQTPTGFGYISPGCSNATPYLVTNPGGEYMHSQPDSSVADRVGSIAPNTCVQVSCKAMGEVINGTYGPDSTWDFVTNPAGVQGYVSDEYVDTKGAIHLVAICPGAASG